MSDSFSLSVSSTFSLSLCFIYFSSVASTPPRPSIHHSLLRGDTTLHRLSSMYAQPRGQHSMYYSIADISPTKHIHLHFRNVRNHFHLSTDTRTHTLTYPYKLYLYKYVEAFTGRFRNLVYLSMYFFLLRGTDSMQ